MFIKIMFFTILFTLNQGLLLGSDSLKAGDKVIIYGDGSLSEIVKYAKKELKDELKKMKVKIEEKGKKGSVIGDLIDKLEKDVIGKKPNLVLITVPLADLYDAKEGVIKDGVSSEAFFSNIKMLAETLHQSDIPVAIATPCLAGENISDGSAINTALDKVAADIRSYCELKNIKCCDYRKAAVNYLKSNNPDKKSKGILTKKGVHISKDGAEILSRELKKCLGLSSSGIDSPLVASDRVVFFKGGGSQWAGDHFKNMGASIQERIDAKYAHLTKILRPSYKIMPINDGFSAPDDHSPKILGQKARVSFIQLFFRAYNTADAFNSKFDQLAVKYTTLCEKISDAPHAHNMFFVNAPIADLDANDPLRIAYAKMNKHIEQCARDNGLQVLDLNQIYVDAVADNPGFKLWRAPKSPYYSHEFLQLVGDKICSIIGVGE